MKIHFDRTIKYLMVFAVCACSDIKAPDPIRLASSETLYKLRFSTKAVRMVTGDTITLRAVATFADSSQTIIDPARVNWRSLDVTRVRIEESGKITAGAASASPTDIIATYTYNGVTKADTIPIYVTATRIDADEIKIVMLDSAKVGALAFNPTPRIRIDLYKNEVVSQTGVQLPLTVPGGLRVTPVVVSGSPGIFNYAVFNDKSILGSFFIHASFNLYGNEVRDSVEFTGVYPAGVLFNTISRNAEGDITAGTEIKPGDPIRYLQPCAAVKIFVLSSTKPIDIVFSDSLPLGDETCAPLSDQEVHSSGPVAVNQISGNVLNVPLGGLRVVVRRSATIGEVSYYVRDAVTKERLKVSGKYHQK